MTTDLAVTSEDLWIFGDEKSRAARTVEILLPLSRFGFGGLIEWSWRACWLPARPPELGANWRSRFDQIDTVPLADGSGQVAVVALKGLLCDNSGTVVQ